MALLFADNFDFYTTGQILDYWTSGGGGGLSIGAFGRNGTNGLRNPLLLFKALPDVADTTCIFGAAITFQTISSSPGFQRFITFTDGVTSQFVAGVFDDGRIKVSCGGVDYFSTFVLTAGVAYYIDVFAVIHNTLGEFQVRIGTGSVMTPILTRTNIDTQTTSNTRWDGILVSGAAMDMDDIYICDGSGTLNNDVLGNVRVFSQIPQTDAVAAGFNAGLTPSTSTDHGALIDETTPNDDTDYNGSATPAVKDTYHLADLTSSSPEIKGVIAVLRAKKTDRVTRTACPVLRTLGADYDGDTVGVTPTYTYLSQVYNVNPATGLAWTGPQVNALELGLKAVV